MTRIVSENALSDLALAFGTTTLPDTSGVLGEWWFGGDFTASRKNRVTQVDATVVGTPTYGEGYASMGHAVGGFVADIALPNSSTVVALLKATAGIPLVLGTNAADGFGNLNLYMPGGGVSLGNGAIYGSTDQSFLTVTAGVFTLVMGVGLLNQVGRIYRINEAGVAFDDATAGGYVLPASRYVEPFRVGGAFNANLAGNFDIAALAIFDGAKGQAFLEEIYLAWKAKAASRGVTVS